MQKSIFLDSKLIKTKKKLVTIKNQYYLHRYAKKKIIKVKNSYKFFTKNLKTKIKKINSRFITTPFYLPKVSYSYKKLFHIKNPKNFKEYIYFELMRYTKTVKYKRVKKKPFFENNHINLFFKLKGHLNLLRVLTLAQFHINLYTHKRINKFFLAFKYYPVLHYIWLIEWGVLLFFIKIKMSNSLFFSLWLIHLSIFLNGGSNFLDRWSYVSIGTPLQFVFSLTTLLHIKYNLFKFIELYHFFIQFNRYLYRLKFRYKKSLRELLPNRFFLLYFFKFYIPKFIEFDLKTFIFIILPLTNWKIYYSIIYLKWYNYWNHRIMNWKFLT